MQTYVQKHKEIQAFQFNGTWRQLYRELPEDIWSTWFEYYFDIKDSSYLTSDELSIEYDEYHYIKSLVMNDGLNWPDKKIKLKRHKYNHIPKVLYQGDYLKVTPLKIYRRWTVTNMLSIIPKAQFEAHYHTKVR